MVDGQLGTLLHKVVFETLLPRQQLPAAALHMPAELHPVGCRTGQVCFDPNTAAEQNRQPDQNNGDDKSESQSWRTGRACGRRRRWWWFFGAPAAHGGGCGCARRTESQIRQPHRPSFRTFQAGGFENCKQLAGLLAQFGFSCSAQQSAGRHGVLVTAQTHQGRDYQQPDSAPIRSGKGVDVGQRGQQLEALAVIPTFKGSFRGAQIQLCRLVPHASTAAYHHGPDPSIGEHFQEQGVGDATINDVSG